MDAQILDDPLPTPAELIDNLVVWCAERQPDYATPLIIPMAEVAAWIGAPVSYESPDRPLSWLLNEEETSGLVERRHDGERRLTMAGWRRFQELSRAASVSMTAFMAMKFADDQMAHVLATCFRPAALAAGFVLKSVADDQPAGLIDDQMRVGLRNARFAVSDLTHASRGAYWEAGFAEGAGKPVIYTCRKDQWETEHPHFDTNHLTTIVWDPEALSDAATRMTAMIRATFPEDARLAD
ncbi:hypothetical protein [Phenylobacterium sp.]|uniref:hypothetical protein n=1 Tax=Phenylobacterium sp. TaxID=1871053 RepID=UPI003564E5E4